MRKQTLQCKTTHLTGPPASCTASCTASYSVSLPSSFRSDFRYDSALLACSFILTGRVFVPSPSCSIGHARGPRGGQPTGRRKTRIRARASCSWNRTRGRSRQSKSSSARFHHQNSRTSLFSFCTNSEISFRCVSNTYDLRKNSSVSKSYDRNKLETVLEHRSRQHKEFGL